MSTGGASSIVLNDATTMGGRRSLFDQPARVDLKDVATDQCSRRAARAGSYGDGTPSRPAVRQTVCSVVVEVQPKSVEVLRNLIFRSAPYHGEFHDGLRPVSARHARAAFHVHDGLRGRPLRSDLRDRGQFRRRAGPVLGAARGRDRGGPARHAPLLRGASGFDGAVVRRDRSAVLRRLVAPFLEAQASRPAVYHVGNRGLNSRQDHEGGRALRRGAARTWRKHALPGDRPSRRRRAGGGPRRPGAGRSRGRGGRPCRGCSRARSAAAWARTRCACSIVPALPRCHRIRSSPLPPAGSGRLVTTAKCRTVLPSANSPPCFWLTRSTR